MTSSNPWHMFDSNTWQQPAPAINPKVPAPDQWKLEWSDSTHVTATPVRKAGHEGNITPSHGEDCPVFRECPHVTCRDKEMNTQRVRAEKAEKDRAISDVQLVEARKERDVLKAELARANRGNNIDRKQVEGLMKELDAVKAQHVKDENELAHKERIIFMKWIGDSVHGPEHVDVTFIREDIANARIAAAEQRAKEAELKSVKYLDRVIELEAHGPRTKEGLFCTVCGTPYDSSEQAPQPHVPKWARELIEKCRSCKNARRIFNFQWGIKERRFGCMHPSCQFPEWIGYSPRYTRQQLRQMSLAEQLKQAQKHAKLDEERKAAYRDELKKMEQKGLEAVAKTAETMQKKITLLEEHLARCVPLENAIPTDNDPRTEIPKEDVHADGTFVQKLTFWLQRGNIAVDPRDVVIFHKSALPAKKEDEMKP